MTADSLRRWCWARPSALEEFRFGREPRSSSLKCEPSPAEALRAEHSAVRAGYHLNKRHWITKVGGKMFRSDGSQRAAIDRVTLDDSLPDELVLGLLEDSYELVVRGLPKRERDRRYSANR